MAPFQHCFEGVLVNASRKVRFSQHKNEKHAERKNKLVCPFAVVEETSLLVVILIKHTKATQQIELFSIV